MDFVYGVSRNRIQRIDTQPVGQAGETQTVTTYVGGFQKVEHANGTVEERYHIGGLAVVTRLNESGALETAYPLKDPQGSVTGYLAASMILNETSLTRFDLWGRRESIDGYLLSEADPNRDEFSGITPNGFTGHEQVDSMGLIHMNGGVYDPILGRFISADPVIQDATDNQAYNRYAYLRNNPLSLTDPSGFSWLGDRWHAFKEGGWRSVACVIYPQLYIGDKALREFGRFARKNQFVAEFAQIAGCYFTGGAGCPFVVAAVTYGVTDGDVGACNDPVNICTWYSRFTTGAKHDKRT